jgi:threonylcarbamoyladenosine tRNA methylthiotransferase MtaB
MNRPYTRKSYGLLVEKIRSRVKDIAIATDILIGFPGESDRCFRNTLDFVKDILPARTHIFTYSPRMGTAAYAMKGAPAADVVKKRYDAMRSAALDASYSFRRKFLGRKLDVLVENERDKSSGSLAGYSDNYIKVCFEGADTLMNRIVPVTICNLDLNRTEGKTTLRNE